MVHKNYSDKFIKEFISLIGMYFTFDLDDYEQKNFQMEFNNWDIILTIKPKMIKKLKEYKILFINNQYIIKSSSKQIDTNNSSLNSSEISDEGISDNKRIINGKKPDENQLSEAKFKNKYSRFLNNNNISLNQKEVNKENYKNSFEEIKERKENKIKPKGLYIRGLNGYLNSLLQCLFYIKKLRIFFINNYNSFKNGQLLCKAFAEVMDGLKNCKDSYFKPKQFNILSGKENYLFLGRKDGDAKDLFFNIIDSFFNELNKEISENQSNQSRNAFTFDDTNKIGVFKELSKEVKQYNSINKLFIGFYETIYNCPKKKDIKIYSIQIEPLISFELAKIAKHFKTKKLNLELCFKYYYREKLKTEFYCSKCKISQINNSYEKIYKPPQILLIVLDRGHDKEFKGEVEIHKYLDLKNIIDEENYCKKNSSLYKLISFSNIKDDNSSNNHYTACCLADNNKYFYFMDENVIEIEEDKLFNYEPYLLFYEQIDINKQDKKENDKIKKEIKIIQINEEKNENTPDGNYVNDNYSRIQYKQEGKKEKNTNNSSLNTSKIMNEEINNIRKKNNGQKNDENNQLLEAKRKNKNSEFLNDNKSLNQQEELLNNKNKISKKALSLNKTDLKFGKKYERVEIDCQKSKENNEKFTNPLEEKKGRNDNEIKPKGLYNLGLNCYMNSLLQCLFYIKELREYFIKNQNKFTSKQQICKAFAEVMNELKNSDNDYVEPKRFKKLMGNTNTIFI